MGDKGLERFLKAQSEDYEKAFEEMSKGKKESHWIWYIYPQIKGLGMSYFDREYSIKSIQEAYDYTKNSTLFKRLKEITKLLLKIEHNNIKEVMWYPDDLKLRSSMTLFSLISGDEIFDKVIDKFYEGEKDLKTIKILKDMLLLEKNRLESNFCKTFEKRINKVEKEEKIKIKEREEREEKEKKLKKEKEKKLKEEKEKKLKEEKDKKLQEEKNKKLQEEEEKKLKGEKDKKLQEEKDKKLQEEKDKKLQEEIDKKLQEEKGQKKLDHSKEGNLIQKPKIASIQESDIKKLEENKNTHKSESEKKDENKDKFENKNKKVNTKESSEKPMDIDEISH